MEKFANRWKLQPVNDRSMECTVMILPHPGLGIQWVKVPCNYELQDTGYICKSEVNGNPNFQTINSINYPYDQETFSKVVEVNSTVHIVPALTVCPKEWNYLDGVCLIMASSTDTIKKSLTCGEAKQICKNMSGSLAHVADNFPGIKEYLYMWLHKPSYGGIWVRHCLAISPEASFRGSGTKVMDFVIGLGSHTKHVPMLNVLCQTDAIKKILNCSKDQFKCRDETCILLVSGKFHRIFFTLL